MSTSRISIEHFLDKNLFVGCDAFKHGTSLLFEIKQTAKELDAVLLSPSVEAFDITGAKDTGKKITELVKGLVKKLLELIGRLYADVRDSITKVGPKLKRIHAQLKEHPRHFKTAEFKVDALESIAIEGVFGFDNTRPLDGLYKLVNFVYTRYPEDLDRLIKNKHPVSELPDRYTDFIERSIKPYEKDIYPGNYKLTLVTGTGLPKMRLVAEKQDVIEGKVASVEVGVLLKHVELLIMISDAVVSRTAQKRTYDTIGRDVLKVIDDSSKTADAEAIGQFINAITAPLGNINEYLKSVLARYTVVLTRMSAQIVEAEAKDTVGVAKNVIRFIDEYKAHGDVLPVRTALRIELNDKVINRENLLKTIKYAEKEVPDLWEEDVVKAFAREIIADKTQWTDDYQSLQLTYLKTNFSKERYLHQIDVIEYLIERGEW